MRAERPLLLLLFSVLAACPDDGSDDDSTPPPSGCVTVAGGGVFDSIQAAIDAAPSGGVINICAGEYDESLEVTKPLTLAGVGPDDVFVLGGGDGTLLEIDLYQLGEQAGAVTITGMTLAGVGEPEGATRGIRITNSPDVTVHDVAIEFEIDPSDDFDHGQLGVEISQSSVILSEVSIISVGFNNPNGGTGILAQTNSTLEVRDCSINRTGAFGIHTVDTELLVSGTQVIATNRNSLAGDLDSDGTGIFVEGSTTETVITDSTIENGVFVGVWIDGPSVRLENSRIASFGYGLYLPGDASSAAARQVTILNSQFEDVAGQSVLAVASVDVTQGTFSLVGGAVGPETGFPRYAGINAIAPDGEVNVTASTFTGNGDWAIRASKGGALLDPDIASVNLTGNTITNIVSGNGIMVLDTASATVAQNIIDGVDHAYFSDIQDDGLPGPGAGSINTGFGFAAFRVSDLNSTGNVVSGSEFANYVFVEAGFASTGDTSLSGVNQGFHSETSQGVLTDLVVEDHAGTAVVFFESTIHATGLQVRRTVRGPFYTDVDGVEDPDPATTLWYSGGRAVEALSNGQPSHATIEGGTFEDNINGALLAQFTRVELRDNLFLNSGFVPEGDTTGMTPGYGIYLYGRDENAAGGHTFEDNVVDGAEGFYGMYVYDAPGTEIRDNVFCGGDYSALSIGDSADLVVEGNQFGEDEDGVATACAEAAAGWSFGLYLSASATDLVGDPIVVEGNVFGPTGVQTGLYYYGLLPVELEDNTFRAALAQGLSASFAGPTHFYFDDDGDGYSELSGDCDDADLAISPGLVEVPGNLVDDDCDEIADDGLGTLDSDGDGAALDAGDCDDADATRNPAAIEDPNNGIDDDCDGTTDLDGEFTRPTLTLLGNRFEGGSPAAALSGFEAGLGSTDDGTPNRFEGGSGSAIQLTSWNGPFPARVPSRLSIAEGTTFESIAGACVEAAGQGTAIVLDGASTYGCDVAAIQVSTDSTLSGSGDASIDGAPGPGIWVFGGTSTFAGVEVAAPGEEGLAIDGGNIVLDGVAVSGAGAAGVRVSAGQVTGTGGLLSANTAPNLQVSGGSVTWTGLEAVGSASAATEVSGGTLSLVDPVITGGSAGILHLAGAVTVDGGQVSGGSANGIDSSAGTLSVEGTEVFGHAGHGISLAGTVVATVDGANLHDNGGSGLLCDGGAADPATSEVSLPICTATVSTNAAGDFQLLNGCEVAWACTAQ